jgi:hypothetical protein
MNGEMREQLRWLFDAALILGFIVLLICVYQMVFQ